MTTDRYPEETFESGDYDDGTMPANVDQLRQAVVGDVMELEVGWSCGNPFYYGYGFSINVVPA